MAKRKKQTDDMPPERKRHKDLLAKVRERYKVMTDADNSNRRQMIEDLRFVHEPGAQWDDQLKQKRGKRPCYEFNKTAVTIKRVINDMRANRPQGKVRAVEDNDKDTADVYEGLIRNIWNVSDGDSVIDYAAEFQVAGGMGAWRVETAYSDDTTFEQDIRITQVRNPLCLYADPAASDMLKRDAQDWIYTDKISRVAFKNRWPKAEAQSFDESEFDDEEWDDDDETVRICEYWYKEPATKELLLLSNGKTVEAETYVPEAPIDGEPPVTVTSSRKVKCYKIKNCIVSGNAVLEEGDWAGNKFPWIQVFGSWLVIDGKVQWYGLTRNAKDAQRSYNVSRTSVTETIALAPQAKNWATPDQAKGNEANWNIAHQENLPYLLYNPDPKAPGPPVRVGGAEVPAAAIQELQLASEEIKSVTGIFDPSLGAQSNETSGRAIAARQRQGEIATFNFLDNLSKGIRLTWEIVVDLIPKIYTNERAIRILGNDGAEKYVRINGSKFDPARGQALPVNDVTRGKYDVTITVGPSFSTQRQEAAELYTQLGQASPQIWGVAGDLIMKSMDLPYAQDIAERMQVLLPPQVQQQIAEGKPVPPEVQAAMAQVQQAQMMLEQQAQMIGQAAQEAEKIKAEAEKAVAKVQTEEANLDTKKAQLEAWIAQQEAGLIQKGLGVREQELEFQSSVMTEGQKSAEKGKQDSDGVIGAVAQVLQGIQQQIEAAMQLQQMTADQAAQIAALIEQMHQPKQYKFSRQNGALVGTDGSRTVSLQRGSGGEMTATVQ